MDPLPGPIPPPGAEVVERGPPWGQIVGDTGVPWGGGVGMMFVGDEARESGSAVAATAVGVAAGVVVWPEQAARTMRSGRNARSGTLFIRVLLLTGNRGRITQAFNSGIMA